MVCSYCQSRTQVTNSRLQKQQNTVWRRRRCLQCGAVVTTEEVVRYDNAFRLRRPSGALEPFSRDKLLLSLHASLAHRQTAIDDAAALCATIIGQVLASTPQAAVIDLATLREVAATCLSRYDEAAATHYRAYHLS